MPVTTPAVSSPDAAYRQVHPTSFNVPTEPRQAIDSYRDNLQTLSPNPVLPVSFNLPTSLRLFCWQAGDSLFNLAVDYLQQMQIRSERADGSGYTANEPLILASVNHWLREQGHALSALDLLGPCAIFCGLYPLFANACNHPVSQVASPYGSYLAAYLAGASEMVCPEPISHSPRVFTPTWQSVLTSADPEGLMQAEVQPMSSTLPRMGLPDAQPRYGRPSPSGYYTLAPASSTVFAGRYRPSTVAPPDKAATANVTAMTTPATETELYLWFDDAAHHAVYAISTGQRPLAVTTRADAVPTFHVNVQSVSARAYSTPPEPVVHTLLVDTAGEASPAAWHLGVLIPGNLLSLPAASAEPLQRETTMPWPLQPLYAETDARQSLRAARGVIHDGPLALVMSKGRSTSRPAAAVSQPAADPLYQLRLVDEGQEQPLFAPPESVIDCLSCLPAAVQPVRATDMGDMIEKALLYSETLPLARVEQALTDYVHSRAMQGTNPPNVQLAGEAFPHLNTVICASEWLLRRDPVNESWHLEADEVQLFLTKLFADTPFDHNEELRAALLATAFIAPMMSKCLLAVLDDKLSVSGQLIRNNYHFIRTRIGQREPLTYRELDYLMAEIQGAFEARFFALLNAPAETVFMSPLTSGFAKIAQWHKQMIEYDFPFMLLRGNLGLQHISCLSEQGLLLNLGVRRVADAQLILSLSPENLIQLGQDLLLNNPLGALLKEFNEMEVLCTALKGEACHGIRYAVEQLKRKGVLLIQFMEAKRRLVASYHTADISPEDNIRAFQRYRQLKLQLYALALESVPETDQALFIHHLRSADGVRLQFVRLGDDEERRRHYRPSIGFLLSLTPNAQTPTASTINPVYFVSLLPIQSDTTQPILVNMASQLPGEVTQWQDYFNQQGKIALLERLSHDMAKQSERYHFDLHLSGGLKVSPDLLYWQEMIDPLVQNIVDREFSISTTLLPGLTPTTLSPAPTPAGMIARLGHLLGQMIYLTPLGSCKDAVVDLIEGHIGNLLLDGGFCIYAFLPGGTEEEEGLKTVGTVIRKVLKKSIEGLLKADEGESLLSKLDSTISEVEDLYSENLLSIAQVKRSLTADNRLKPFLAAKPLNTALSLNSLSTSIRAALVWRDPLHNALFFLLSPTKDQLCAYRLDELNRLLMPNPSPWLISRMLNEAHITEPRLLAETLRTGDAEPLREALYAQDKMRNVARYALKSGSEIGEEFIVVADKSGEGVNYYPATMKSGLRPQLMLSPPGLAKDEWVIVEQTEHGLQYCGDNAMRLIAPSSRLPITGSENIYDNILNHIENIPNGWRIQSIWLQEKTTDKLVVEWLDKEGNRHFRQPGQGNRWVRWESEMQQISCLMPARVRRNNPAERPSVTQLFSPAHCGYLIVPPVSDPRRAEALNALSTEFSNLPEPLILKRIECADLARSIVEDFSDIWQEVPDLLRQYLGELLAWNIDASEFEAFPSLLYTLARFSYSISHDAVLDEEEREKCLAFVQRTQLLLEQFQRLKEKSIVNKQSKLEFHASRVDYFNAFIANNLKANHWLNRWIERIKNPNKVQGKFIIKARTPAKIARDYSFLYQGASDAFTKLNQMAEEIGTKLSSPEFPDYLKQVLESFFCAPFSDIQVQGFKENLLAYLEKIHRVDMTNIIVVADRYAAGRLVAGCLNTPLEKLAFSENVLSFVYSNDKDNHIYLLDYLSNKEFIEYSLAHELGHLTFNNKKYAMPEEIYLNTDSILKNFNIYGASRVARKLMSDRAFFLDYIARDFDFALAFYRHFTAHSTDNVHKEALHEYFSTFLDSFSSGTFYQYDPAARKRELRPLISMLFSQPSMQLNMAYFNPDIFCGLFGYAYEQALALSAPRGHSSKRAVNAQTGEEDYFSSLILSAIFEKHLQQKSPK